MRNKLITISLVLLTVGMVCVSYSLSLKSIDNPMDFSGYKRFVAPVNETNLETIVSALQAGTLTNGVTVTGGLIVLPPVLHATLTSNGVITATGPTMQLSSGAVIATCTVAYVSVLGSEFSAYNVGASNIVVEGLTLGAGDWMTLHADATNSWLVKNFQNN